jgi:sterol desaturase/sphingolipid hydroxylase (fatty acid hydroxylase superfamily)
MNNGYYIVASLLAGLLMVVEHFVARSRGIAAYRFGDTVSSLGSFVGELALTAVLYLNVFYGYHLLETHVGLFEPSTSSWVTWVAAFLALDLVYYLGHRSCHALGLLWALHSVHHQSREFNLAVGMRGPMLSALQIAPFMIPLAIAGLPAEVLFPLYAAHTVWKLLVHTRVIGKLGPLELLFITPSSHRVHHAHNAGYLDKNFGGVLCVWDRLFGTFAAEVEEPAFGPAQAETGLDPLDNNLQPWRALAATARAHGWLSALYGPPRAAAPERPALSDAGRALDAPPAVGMRWRAALQLGGAAGMALSLLIVARDLPLLVSAAAGVAVMVMLGRVGRVLDRAHAAPVAEPRQV